MRPKRKNQKKSKKTKAYFSAKIRCAVGGLAVVSVLSLVRFAFDVEVPLYETLYETAPHVASLVVKTVDIHNKINELRVSFSQMRETGGNSTDKNPPCRMIPNFIPRQGVATSSDEIVMATHTDVAQRRLKNLITQMKQWGGPASVALYITNEAAVDSLASFLSNNTFLPHIGIHLMMELPGSLPYPHNILRNLAMDNLGSDFFFAVDVDFIPLQNTRDGIISLLGGSGSELKADLMNRSLFVLPAFDILPRKGESTATEDMIPESKSELLEMVLDGERALGFATNLWWPAQGPTDFVKYFSKDASDGAYYTIEYAYQFEPYVVGYRPGAPRYWPGFRGYGLNKMSWFDELHRAGYSFRVLRDCAVVHLSHPVNKNMTQLVTNRAEQKKFANYLNQRYPETKTDRYPKTKGNERHWEDDLRQLKAQHQLSQG